MVIKTETKQKLGFDTTFEQVFKYKYKWDYLNVFQRKINILPTCNIIMHDYAEIYNLYFELHLQRI